METTNIRIYKDTHEKLKQMAALRRQDLIVVIDDVIKEAHYPGRNLKAEQEYANTKS